MKVSMPFYNFIMFFVVGALFIILAITTANDSDKSIIMEYFGNIPYNDITIIRVLCFISIAYICGYMISRLGSILDFSTFCNEKTIYTCKLYRWNDVKLIEKAKKYPILYTYAREYSFCRTLTIMFFLLALLSGCKMIFIICCLISLVSTLKGLNKINNALENLYYSARHKFHKPHRNC